MRSTVMLPFLLSLLASPLAAQQPIDTLALRAHTRFLSDDALAGRGTGTEGERLAALYIESQLRLLGLTAPTGGFQQQVPLKRSTITSSRMIIRSAGDSIEFDDDHFLINAGGAASLRDFRGNALFLGTTEQARNESTAAMRGRVLVLLGTLGADAQILIPEWIRQGVAGVIMLIPDPAQFQLFSRSRGIARYHVDAEVNDPVWQSSLPVVIAGPEVSRALVSQVGSALGRLSRNGSLAPVDLGREISVRIAQHQQSVPAHNVIGVVPGRDPALRDEYVVYTAHYDHLGISTPDARGDSIYNGFSDNAAGVAMLLAVAAEFMRNKPARSVAFVFFTGEERGLLGSSYYVTNPPIPLSKTVAVINLDAGAPPAPPTEWRLAGGAANTIGALARELATRKGWKLDPGEPSPNSDYWPFHTRGIPAVFLIPGNQWENTTTAQRDALRARWDRYHRADDEWAENFPFSGLRRYAEVALDIGREIANRPERPRMLTVPR